MGFKAPFSSKYNHTQSMITNIKSIVTVDVESLSQLVDQLKELSLSSDKSDRHDAIDLCQQICDLSVEISARLSD